MSKLKTTALLAALSLSLASAQSSLAPIPTDPAWTLLWSDEFNGRAGTQPSEKSWTYELGNEDAQGWGNRELQFYTKDPQNVRLDGQGNLDIRALTNTLDLWCFNGDACPYTSARLKTQGKVEVKYGKIETRIRVPAGAGMWPAFWMLGSGPGGWPKIGEVDIMEWLGRTPKIVYGTLHGPGYNGDRGISQLKEMPAPLHGAFHTFTVIKRPTEIVWLVNGEQYHRVTPKDLPAGGQWVFDRPFYLLLNLAVGGNWPGPVGKDTVFPGVMKVDYVRVWKSKNS